MAENKKILLKSSAGDNLYPRASLDNLVDVVGGTTAVHVPTLDSDGRIESRFLPAGMSLLDSDGRIDSRYLPPDFFPPAARVTLSGTVYVSSGALLRDAFQRARDADCKTMKISIVEENAPLKQWYVKNGFVHLGTKKFEFFPFTCGYMEKVL